MICGIHVSIQWKVTFPTAVKGIIPIWCYDPVLQGTKSSYRQPDAKRTPFCYKMCLLTCHSKSLKLTNSVCIWQLLEDQCAEESETDKQYDTQCSPT